MFCRTVSDENSAPCWNRMPHRPAAPLRAAVMVGADRRSPITSISPLRRGMRPMIVRISTDLPPPEAPTRPRISPLRTSSDKMIDHDMPAETDHEVAARESQIAPVASCIATFRSMRRTPQTAVEHDHQKDRLHDRSGGLLAERLRRFPSPASPSLQATMPITSAMNGALMMPTSKWVTDTASCSRAMKIAGPMPP